MTSEHTANFAPSETPKEKFFKAVIPQGPGQQGKEMTAKCGPRKAETSSAWPHGASPHPAMGEAGNRTSRGSEPGGEGRSLWGWGRRLRAAELCFKEPTGSRWHPDRCMAHHPGRCSRGSGPGDFTHSDRGVGTLRSEG